MAPPYPMNGGLGIEEEEADLPPPHFAEGSDIDGTELTFCCGAKCWALRS